MKKLLASLLLLTISYSVHANSSSLLKDAAEAETYFQVLGDLFANASVPSIEELQDTAHPGRCFLRVNPNSPIASGYMFRVAPKGDVGPLLLDKDTYQISSYWDPTKLPNFYDEMALEDIIEQLGPDLKFKRVKSFEGGVTVDLNKDEVSVLRVSGEYLIEEVRQGNETHIRCYYFMPAL